MHAKGILQELLYPVIHKKALDSVTLLVTGLLNHKKLAVTALGRGIDLPIQERSGVRRADRLLSNQHLHHSRQDIYKVLVHRIVNQRKRPRIIADWSHIPNTKQYLLRASLAAKKRAITLYEDVYPESELSNRTIETQFLQTLHHLLPEKCRPIIITDAGFRNGWFKTVKQLGWDYLGRVRSQGAKGAPFYFDGKEWKKCQDLYAKANSQVHFLGKVTLSKRSPFETNLFLYKGPFQNQTRRIRTRKHGCRDKKYYQRAAQDPWLLASSIPGKSWLRRQQVIKLYQLRMQIEESFRDLKCARDGFGMENAYSYKSDRIKMLLLLAMLASFLAWLVGCFAEKQVWRSFFQVNSTSRSSISLWYLGIQVLKRELPSDLTLDDLLSIAYRFIP